MDTAALLATAMVVFAGAIYWFIYSLGCAEVKGKRVVDLKMGKIPRDKIEEEYKRYWSFFLRPKDTVSSPEKVPSAVNGFYDLVTDIYEWGWGQSFHFSPSIPNRSHREATRIHEERIVDLIKARRGDRILDVGCGIGGPMRTIAIRSGAEIVGINNNEYQVIRARSHNRKAGLDRGCEVVMGDFCRMPFDDCSFDGAYAMEATCHAASLEDVYGEIWRVLKPGGLFFSSEWVTTMKYKADDPIQAELIRGIEQENAIPGLRRQDEIRVAARNVGFDVIEKKDLGLPLAGKWWERLKTGRMAHMRNHAMVWMTSVVGIAPKGVVEVHGMLVEAARHLVEAGETGVFTPMYMIVCRKPGC